MPSFFNKPCKFPGCKCYSTSNSSYCEKHLKEMQDKKAARIAELDRNRGTRTERGYTNAWLKASKAFLVAHPLCAECARQGKTTPATEVDHIIPHKGNMDLFWDQNNWQSLCHSCHSRKTFLHDGAFGRTVTPRGSLK